MHRLARILLTLFCLYTTPLCGDHSVAQAQEKTLHVLTTTFPVYQLTRNITAGVTGVEVDLMIPAQLGCPHDYVLTPQDMRKLAKAQVLVVNGLGMEEFLGAPIEKANPKLNIVDSSQGINAVLRYTEQEQEDSDHRHPDDTKDNAISEHKEEHHHHHPEGAPNPHLFASPRMAALMAATIAQNLGRIYPVHAAQFTTNAQAYAQKMNLLADEMLALGKQLDNNRIVTQHGVFDYLARDMGLQVVAVIQAHDGQDPAAAEILDIIATIKEKKAGAIFTEPQYPEAVGKTIAKEASITSALLDPVANGPEGAPLDYYAQIMRTNMKTLEKILGKQ